MAMPLRQSIKVATYLAEQKLRRRDKFPLIVELEPLFACNLKCEGCGKIQHPAGVLKQRMPVAQAVGAVLESGAPMVSIAGGEPLMHPQIDEIVRQLVARRKYVFLCTNAMLLRKKMDKFTPSPYFAFAVHIDGLRERHDESVAKEGVFDEAVAAIKEAKRRGFRVTTNSTFFNTDTPQTIVEVLNYLNDDLKVDEMMISPAYAYEKAPDQEHFLGVEQTRELFKKAFAGWQPAPLAAEPLPALPRLPRGQGGLPVHRLGDPQLLPVRLAAPLLPDERRVRADLPGTHRGHRLGQVRPRQGPALRQLHGSLRLRAHRRPRHHGLPQGVAARHARDRLVEQGVTQMTAVSLGLPEVPATLAVRRKSLQIQVGSVAVGGNAPVSVQSMTTTRTSDIGATLQQIAELTASGCQIVRVACPTQDDADALPVIAKKSQIPVIADIHFQPKYVFAAIEAGCAAVRVNPGNIKKFDDQVKEIAKAAKDHGTPIRIGVNAGSLDRRLLQKYGKATPEALVESALWEASLFEEHDFRDIKISVKHNDPVVMVEAYRQLAEQCDYPLHLGVTEAGPAFQGTIKSAVAFGALLSQGIGDTIRVSLSAPPVEEIKVGIQILESLNLRQRGLEIVSCPSCGRAQVDVYKLAEEVTAGLTGMEVPLRVAVMGCVVNGPGEAREADLGVASGNGKGQIFVKGEVIKTVPESKIVETLIEEAMRIAEQMEKDGIASGELSRHRELSSTEPKGARA